MPRPRKAPGAADRAQPGAAVPRAPLAKPAKDEYRRNLPHIQAEERPLFVTFRTWRKWSLPVDVRSLVLNHCLHDHGTKLWMHCAIVMPDHVHLLFTPLRDAIGNSFGLAEIMNGIKGSSAHSVNKALRRRGHVWQDESHDHLLRRDESIEDVAQYIAQNPIRKGLANKEGDYPWLWRE